MSNTLQQQTDFLPSGANIGGFQSSINPGRGQPISFFFAGGVPAPSSGIYTLTPAPPGGLSSLGPRVTGLK